MKTSRPHWLSISISCLSLSFTYPLIHPQLLALPLLAQEQLESLIYRAYIHKKPLNTVPDDLTVSQAQIIQDKFIQSLVPILGKPVGYKAGLTNPKVQAQLGVSQPLYGVVLEKMLMVSGTSLPLDFGTRPRVEGDLIVRVKDEKINEAQNSEELLNSLDAVIPFVELPDLIYGENVPISGAKLVAINLGARKGIIGQVIPIERADLKNISLTIFNEKGQAIASGNSQALPGDPLDVIIGLREHLQKQGKSLKKGDLISLGSLTPMLPVNSPQTLRAEYKGLKPEGTVTISVKFTNPEPD